MGTSLFSNALKACVNEVDNTQKKDEKFLFRKFCFSIITFCTCLVVMKVGLFLALFFALLLGVLIGVDKRAGFRHTLDDEEYEILKQLATGKFVKPVKERSRKEKSAVIKFWRSKGKYTVNDDNSSALLYDGKQILQIL